MFPTAPIPGRLTGALLGQLVGDCIGLPREGLSPRRAAKLFGPEPRLTFVFGRGMMSDDTEHACLVGQALLRSGLEDPEAFARSLAWGLRWWFAGLPAGLGKATLKACLKLWLGFPPHKSGVCSAGNGPAMRAALLGAALANAGRETFGEYVLASTRLTHTDRKAELGALAVADGVRYLCRETETKFHPIRFVKHLGSRFANESEGFVEPLMRAVSQRCEPAEFFLEELGCPHGPTGYMFHTVPAAVWAFTGAPDDFRDVMRRCCALGGDCDTVAAIAGALSGARLGPEGIPAEWLSGVLEYPRTVVWIRELGERLEAKAQGGEAEPMPLAWPGLLPRNIVFMTIVMAHAFRRMAPPY
ncbi:MAG: ADP-ribosylglycohydrolase family protein [Sumerlaeia bacterium]